MPGQALSSVSERRVAGSVLVLLGALALIEARRLSALREEMVAGAVVGDDTFPMILGVALVLLGGYVLFLARWRASSISFPAGDVRRRILGSAGVFSGYYFITPYLGYTLSTLLASMALFKTMGAYRWQVALLMGAATTATLYLMFRVWLLQPLPTGWLGI
jgi:putative tricarboxylic transport membrane protein